MFHPLKSEKIYSKIIDALSWWSRSGLRFYSQRRNIKLTIDCEFDIYLKYVTLVAGLSLALASVLPWQWPMAKGAALRELSFLSHHSSLSNP